MQFGKYTEITIDVEKTANGDKKIWYGAKITREDDSVVELAPMFTWPTEVEAFVAQNAVTLGLAVLQ